MQKLRNAQNWPKMFLFFKSFLLLFFATIRKQLKARSLKISSNSEHICRKNVAKVPKNGEKVSKSGCTNTFASGNPSRHFQITFFI